jgi:hypothetical protein
LNTEAKDRVFEAKDLTAMMQAAINGLLRSARVDFWRRTLDLKEVKSRLTAKKREEFEHALTDRCHMDFTENNIRQFVLNLIGSYEKTLTDAVLDLFDMFTVRHTWHEDNKHEKNIHYFNGWKTNNAFKVAKRVVIPVRGRSYGSAFRGWKGWDLDCGAAQASGATRATVLRCARGGAEERRRVAGPWWSFWWGKEGERNPDSLQFRRRPTASTAAMGGEEELRGSGR